jgi:hypothetical protein
LSVACAALLAGQPLTLEQVLERAAAYVADFDRQLSGIVAEEDYVQEVRLPKSHPLSLNVTRRMRSDLLLVKPVGGEDWIQFRDVFELDGEPVRDRNDRLVRLFLHPDETTRSQTAAILRESARYNIGSVERTVNTPVLPLLFLEAKNQARFKFRRTRDTDPGRITAEAPTPPGHFRLTTEVWAVEFRERMGNTIIRTTALRDLPARGRFWIEPDTGRVLMSELILQDRFVRGIINVNYQSVPLLGLLVPIEMRERYDRLRDKSTIDGFATYGRFRQFQVKVDEKLGPIKK